MCTCVVQRMEQLTLWHVGYACACVCMHSWAAEFKKPPAEYSTELVLPEGDCDLAGVQVDFPMAPTQESAADRARGNVKTVDFGRGKLAWSYPA